MGNENIVDTKYINDLIGKSFYIPKYQRGYRWDTQNVKDLLNDIYEVYKTEGTYCLQPLVVKELEQEEDLLAIIKQADSICAIKELLSSQGEKFNVVDGQQRLTTILILLRVLNEKLNKKETYYEIKYESRGNIFEKNKDENIDSFYANNTKTVIEDWLTKIKDEEFSSESFLDYILGNIYFIWYQLNSEADEISSFIRLNKGKIPLTNSELIKALILNESNFDKASISTERAKIANKWDEIESTLQKDDFWYFIYNEKKDGKYNKPTRIDYLFEILKEIKEKKRKTNETDNESTSSIHEEYCTFRYFYNICKKDKKYTEIWEEIKQKYNIIKEWYNSIEFYHYVGFLRNIDSNESLCRLLEEWDKGDKERFLDELKDRIRKSIKDIKDLSIEYELNKKKVECKPLLLLFNIQTIINQNAKLLKSKKYHQGVFYKFPFGIFQKEEWDVEHIASITDNPLDEKAVLIQFIGDLFIADKITSDEYYNWKNEIDSNDLNRIISVKSECLKKLEDTIKKENIKEKNKIYNFTLLDYRTNRSYGNSIFSTKRRHIIAKDKGKILEIKDGKIYEKEPNNDDVAFVPPCTKNVFLKYYTPNPTNLHLDFWSEVDGKNYATEIYNVLKDFGVRKEISEK